MTVCEILGKTVAEMVPVLKEAFKDKTMGKTQVYECCHHFKRGEISGENHPRSGHPSMSRTYKNVEKVCQAVLTDLHWTIEKISEITVVSWNSC
jgi:hypothetical protein